MRARSRGSRPTKARLATEKERLAQVAARATTATGGRVPTGGGRADLEQDVLRAEAERQADAARFAAERERLAESARKATADQAAGIVAEPPGGG